MTDKLPPQLLALFQPRPPLRYLAPTDHAAEDRVTSHVDGVAQFLPDFTSYPDDLPYTPTESWLQKHDRLKQERKQAHQHHLTAGLKEWNPKEDPLVVGDPYKTLFVARLSYDVTEEDLKKTFGRFGPIERVRLSTFDAQKYMAAC